jgi:hypothetical protein
MENNFDSAKAYYESVSEYQRNQIYNIMVGYASHISPAVTPPVGIDREELMKKANEFQDYKLDNIPDIPKTWYRSRHKTSCVLSEFVEYLKEQK